MLGGARLQRCNGYVGIVLYFSNLSPWWTRRQIGTGFAEAILARIEAARNERSYNYVREDTQ